MTVGALVRPQSTPKFVTRPDFRINSISQQVNSTIGKIIYIVFIVFSFLALFVFWGLKIIPPGVGKKRLSLL